MADTSSPSSPPSSSSPPAAASAPAPAAPTPVPVMDAAAAKAAAIRTANAAALQSLSSYFGAERWSKLIARAQRAGLDADDITALAGEMVATRKVYHPKNAKAALIGAANGFICAIGLSPTEADMAAFDSALAATAV